MLAGKKAQGAAFRAFDNGQREHGGYKSREMAATSAVKARAATSVKNFKYFGEKARRILYIFVALHHAK